MFLITVILKFTLLITSVVVVVDSTSSVRKYTVSGWFISNVRFIRGAFGASFGEKFTIFSRSVVSIFRTMLVEFEVDVDEKPSKTNYEKSR